MMTKHEFPKSVAADFSSAVEATYQDLIKQAVAAERDALEAELLKLKKGIGASSMYTQGRWDLIGEFQDIIRARGNRT